MRQILGKVIGNDFGITFFKKMIMIVTGLLTTIFVARWLGVELRGEYSYIINTVNITTTVLNLGISLIYPNFVRQYGFKVRDTFVFITLAQFFLFLAIGLGYYYYSHDITTFYISFLTCFGVLSLQFNQLLIVDSIKNQSVVSIVSSLAYLLLAFVCFMFYKKNLHLALIIYISNNTVMSASYFFYYRFRIRNVDFKIIWKVLKMGFLPMLTTVLIVINYRADVIILEKLHVDFKNIGLFSIGVSLAEYAWFIPDLFKEVMINKNTSNDAVESTMFSLRAAVTAVLVFVVAFIVLGKFTIKLLFGAEYSDAYIVTLLMFLAVPFMVYVKVIGTLFMGQGKWNYYFFTLLVAVILNVGFNYWLIPMYGIIGAAVASIISYSFSGIVFFRWFVLKYNVSSFDIIVLKKKDFLKFKEFIRKKL